jgi:hypothetical protein
MVQHEPVTTIPGPPAPYLAAATVAAAAQTEPARRGDRADVVYVLLLVQVGAGLLSMLGEVLFMGGNPLYALAPLTRAIATLVFAALAVRGRTGALIGVIVLQSLTLIGFTLSALVGLLPMLDFTPTLTGLLTGVALPVAVIIMCSRLLPVAPTGGGVTV